MASNQRIKFFILLKGQCHKIWSVGFFIKEVLGPEKSWTSLNNLKFEYLHENSFKKSKLAPKISFLMKKTEIQKSFDTVSLIHNSIRVQTSFDRVLTV